MKLKDTKKSCLAKGTMLGLWELVVLAGGGGGSFAPLTSVEIRRCLHIMEMGDSTGMNSKEMNSSLKEALLAGCIKELDDDIFNLLLSDKSSKVKAMVLENFKNKISFEQFRLGIKVKDQNLVRAFQSRRHEVEAERLKRSLSTSINQEEIKKVVVL